MKYAKRIPEPDPELRESLLAEGWGKIKEPKSLFLAIIYAFPFMFINAAFCYLILFLVDPAFTELIANLLFSVSWSFTIRFDYIIYLYLFVVAHEFIHLVFIPNFYRSENVCFGIKPWGGFVFTTDKLSKGRYLLIAIAPYMVISIFLPIILGLADLLSGFVVFVIFLNALSSSVDILNATLIAVWVPNGSIIVNNGFETYYRKY